MGLRFRKTITIAPGVKLNINKKSIGLSIGGKMAGISLNSRTGAQARVSAPGTGFSYTKKLGGKKKKAARRAELPETCREPEYLSEEESDGARCETTANDWQEEPAHEPLEEIQWQEEFPEE